MTTPGNPTGSGGSTTTGTSGTATGAGTSPGTTTTTNAGTTGSADLTSATTTAIPVQDQAADQSDADLAAFFSTGVGPAMHYDNVAQHASSAPVQATTGSTP